MFRHRFLSIFVIAGVTGLIAQEEPITEQGYEREELGVNRYTAPSIARIFQQLDDLRPLPFELDLSRQRARILAQQDLVEYFASELKTLPPMLAHKALFEKIRVGINAIRVVLNKPTVEELKLADVRAIHAQGRAKSRDS